MTKKKSPKPTPEPDLRPEYDFSNGVRGKYAKFAAEDVTITISKDPVTRATKKKPKRAE